MDSDRCPKRPRKSETDYRSEEDSEKEDDKANGENSGKLGF